MQKTIQVCDGREIPLILFCGRTRGSQLQKGSLPFRQACRSQDQLVSAANCLCKGLTSLCFVKLSCSFLAPLCVIAKRSMMPHPLPPAAPTMDTYKQCTAKGRIANRSDCIRVADICALVHQVVKRLDMAVLRRPTRHLLPFILFNFLLKLPVSKLAHSPIPPPPAKWLLLASAISRNCPLHDTSNYM